MRNLSQLFKVAEKFTASHSPVILTSIGVAGVLTTAVLTGRASIIASKIVEDMRAVPDGTVDGGAPLAEEEVPLDRIAIVKAVWRLYIPPLSVAAVTIVCVIASNRIGTRRAAAMAAAYTVAERGFEEYRAEVVKRLGEKKEREVRDEVQQERVRQNPPPVGNSEVRLLNPEDVLCYDAFSDRWFKSSMQKILAAQNQLNYQMNNQEDASLNELYSLLGLGAVKYGDALGWTAMQKLEIIPTSVLTEDQKPALAISFLYDPVDGYSS